MILFILYTSLRNVSNVNRTNIRNIGAYPGTYTHDIYLIKSVLPLKPFGDWINTDR